MSPFMRKIRSLKVLKVEGTDPEFFRVGELIGIPGALAHPIACWCKEMQVANTALSSKGVQHDEPLDVFYVSLATKAGQSAMQKMLKAIAGPFVDAINASASAINCDSIFTAGANGPVDAMSALGALRNLLMACATKPARAEGNDVTLVIYV